MQWAGIAGDDAARVVFPSISGRPTIFGITVGMDFKDSLGGEGGFFLTSPACNSVHARAEVSTKTSSLHRVRTTTTTTTNAETQGVQGACARVCGCVCAWVRVRARSCAR